MLYVRYKFESNSQQPSANLPRQRRCVCYTLDTSLKAIHNGRLNVRSSRWDVYAIR